MASAPTFTSFANNISRTTGQAFGFTADAVYVVATVSSAALVLTKPDTTTINCGFPTIGTLIPIPCTSATFGGGGTIIALQAQ